ncbi:MAG: hypothetical protein IJ106_11915 [Parasporobacterium sp.]|nr:hypothetical protein [Parasporobacterium sp.]
MKRIMNNKKASAAIVILSLMMVLIMPCAGMAAGNSIFDAEQIRFAESYNGNLSDTNESDFYEITTPSSGRIELNAMAGMKWINYSIYDVDGNQLWQINPSWNETTGMISTNEYVDLVKGTYYFVVQKDGSNTGDYKFSLNFTDSEESFEETMLDTNNSLLLASVLKSFPENADPEESSGSTNKEISVRSYEYNGQLAINDSKDFYEFTMSSSGRVLFTAAAEMKWIYYTIYDMNGNQLWQINPSWNETSEIIATSESIDLIQGIYYLAITADGNCTGDYSFSMQFVSSDESFSENAAGSNNDIYSADTVEYGYSYKGQIAINDEKDFYIFEMPSSDSVTINLRANMEWIYCTLYDASANQVWSSNPSWNDVSERITVQEQIDLSQGTYYFCISRDGNRTGDYEFSIGS